MAIPESMSGHYENPEKGMLHARLKCRLVTIQQHTERDGNEDVRQNSSDGKWHRRVQLVANRKC